MVDIPVYSSTNTITSDYPCQDHHNVPLEEAVRIVRSIAHKTGVETVPIDEAEGRILGEGVNTPTDMPGFDRSTRDGYALISSDTLGASREKPSVLELIGSIRKGSFQARKIRHGQVIAIETGAILPEGADSVIQSEDCIIKGNQVSVRFPIQPHIHIIRRDEDYRKNQLIYPEGWAVRPQDIPVLASIGKIRIKVRKKPIIGIISTGRELIPSESIPKSGEVREVNSYLISAFCKRQGAIPMRYGIVRDDSEELSLLLKEAAEECDAIIVSGGSSRDKHDITAQVIRTLGKVHTEGISFAPDKRTTIGRIGTVLVIGLPGHPSATFMVLTLVVIHLIQAMKGSPTQAVYRKRIRLADHLLASRETDRYVRVRITDDRASPVFGKSGLIHMLSQSDGIVKIPAGSKGYREGEMVEVMTW